MTLAQDIEELRALDARRADLKARFKEYLATPQNTLRAKLIHAVSMHGGWEEAAVALVDEAIMPIVAKQQELLARAREALEECAREMPDKHASQVRAYNKAVEAVTRLNEALP